MRNVVWKGQLDADILLDTISNKSGLYGLGPVSFLKGELMINDGKSYVSKVVTDSTMTVEETYKVDAPFFVYANVPRWETNSLPPTIHTIADLESFLTEKARNTSAPFPIKLIGRIKSAIIHIQNLPDGTKVASPKEAHSGQVKYPIGKEEVTIVGFYSQQHQGIFTHHDTFLHLHLITQDEQQMGHLDEVVFEEMTLFLAPENAW